MPGNTSTAALKQGHAIGTGRVSVVIKALNEARHIDAAVRSALAAVAVVGGEVILADSVSTDGTVDIALRHPITVVQLKHASERRCGIGPQLGYQQARGDFVYILDGDMELDPDFLPAALAAMESDPGLGGVGGLVEEASVASYQFRGRKRRANEKQSGECRWLDMGGLYRTSALREVGYFSDRNLHAYEEMDLGLRLTQAGWRLRRIAVPAVLHHGRTESNWSLLAGRWRSRYLDGAGELLRAAFGRPYFMRAALTQKHLFAGLLIWVGLIAGLLALPATPWPLVMTLAVTAGLILVRARHTENLTDAMFGQVVWQVTALAMVRGFLTRPRNPLEPIDSVVLSGPDRPQVAVAGRPACDATSGAGPD